MGENSEIGDHDSMKKSRAETDFSESTSIMYLPNEMLIEIMDKLSSTDRAQCRLVSKAWYNSVCALYAQKEKICITSLYEDCLDEVWRTLSKSARPLLHLEFCSLQFSRGGDGEAQLTFWKACGSKVLSLKLNSCSKGTEMVFRNILEYCSNLQTLELDGLGPIFLRKCVRHELRNTSLRTLNIHFKDKYKPVNKRTENKRSYFYLEALCYLFSLFPCLSNFSSSQCNMISYYANFKGEAKKINKKRTFKYIAQLHEYFARDQMESIAIPWLGLNWRDWTSFMSVLSTRTTKITETIIILNSENWNWESFLEFSSRQTNIQKVTCVSLGRDCPNKKFQGSDSKFYTLFQNVPSVRRHLWLRKQEFPTLSNKKKIGTAANVIQYLRMNTLNKFSPVLANIESCNIETFDDGEDFDCVLRSLPNLKHLHLSHLNDATFKSICTNQLKLESFIVDSAASSRIISESMARMVLFRNLKYLKLPRRVVLQPHYLSNNLRFLQFYDWNVEMFRAEVPPSPISVQYRSSLKVFSDFYQSTSPFLEVLRLDFDCKDCFLQRHNFFRMSDWERCEYFREIDSSMTSALLADFPPSSGNLKYLYIRNGPLILTVEDVSPIFQRSRSLRVLVISNSPMFQIFFKHAIYNCITRKVANNIDAIEFFENSRHFSYD